MKRTTTNLVIIGAIFLLLVLGCNKSDQPSDSGGIIETFGIGDETDSAVALVTEANAELKQVGKINQKNQEKIEALKQALADKNVEDMKKITDELVAAINDGLTHGETAAAKLKEAQDKKINSTYKEYLSLQEDALRKRIEAFEFRRDAARVLRDQLDNTKDKQAIEKISQQLKRSEENFQQLMEVAEGLIDQAKELTKKKSS